MSRLPAELSIPDSENSVQFCTVDIDYDIQKTYNIKTLRHSGYYIYH
jgi:hypothetical protein